MRVSFTITLDPEGDKDIISYLNGYSGIARNKLVRELIRLHMRGEFDRETTKGLLRDIKDDLAKLLLSVSKNGISISKNNIETPSVPSEPSTEELSEVLANIDNLGV